MPGTAKLVAALLAFCLGSLALLSHWQWAPDTQWDLALPDPLLIVVAPMVLAGLVYMALPRAVARWSPTPRAVVAMLLVGLGLRLIMLASAPVLELDFYRYLWDGGVAAAGLNPFAVAPQAVLDGAAPAAWLALGEASDAVLPSVTYPQLRTIYPSVAQAAFAVAHWLEPWNLTALRLVLLAFELAGVLLLLALLQACGRSPLWAALYWWNPLVIKELVNSAHMDALLLPLLLGALLLAVRSRELRARGAAAGALLASALLAAATAVKVWPTLLWPTLLRPALGRPGLLLAAAGLFLAVAGLFYLPLLLTRLDAGSGFIAYAGDWERNAALFALLRGALEQGFAALGLYQWDAGRLARLLVAAALLALALGLNRQPAADATALCRRALVLTAALFLLSPTGYPWYLVWFAPLLAVVPVTGLLALTPLLPLYYLRFYLQEHGDGARFETLVVGLQFAPVLLLLLWQALRRTPTRTRRAVPQ